MDVLDQGLELVLGAVGCEVGDLGLEAAHQVGGGVDDLRAELEDGVGPALQVGGEFRRVGVEADAEQAVALLPGGAEGGHEVHGDRSGGGAGRAQARSRRSMKRPAKIAPPTQLLWRKALKQSARSRARIRV